MPKYKVPCHYTNTEIIIVEADSKEDAMNKVYNDFGEFECIEEFEGDVEVHYHDITEIKE